MSDRLITAQNSLNRAVPEVRKQLSQFISNDNFDEQITLAFDQHSDEIIFPLAGAEISDLSTFQPSNDARNIISQWLGQESIFPEIEIVSSAAIDGAQGAYAEKTNQIYLSQEFLIENQHDSDAVESVVLEELGHSFSAQINSQDVPGDEGAIFSRLVRQEAIGEASARREASPLGERIAPETLAALKAEDDTATVNLNGESIQIEQAREGVNPAFDLIGLTDLRNDPDFKNIDGTGADVVVIDTGLDATHPLLDDNYKLGYDFVNEDINPNDLDNHGTHVAGTIGAENENIGVAPDVGLIGLKIAEDRQLNEQAIADALQQVLDEVTDPNTQTNIVAVNLSLGGGFYTQPNQPNSLVDQESRRLIADLEAAGVVVVAAAGNNYEGKRDSNGDIFDASGNVITPNQLPNLSSPAIYSTISVGAVWQDNVAPDSIGSSQVPGKDRIAAFSQRLDSDNFLFAPGATIESTIPETVDGELFAEEYGTSQASPHVAGSVALLQEIAADYNVRLTPTEVKDYLIDNADIINDGDDEIDLVDNTNLDYPRINIYQSAIALKEDLDDFVAADAASIELNSLSQDSISDGDREVSADKAILASIAEDDTGHILGASDLRDLELYRFVATEDQTIKIQVDASQESNTAPGLRLFDADGQAIASNDGENSLTQGSLLEVAVEADTEYYIEVNGIDISDSSTEAKDYDPLTGQLITPENQANYTLTIDALPQSPQTTNSTADYLSNNLDSSLPIYPITQSDLEVSSEIASAAEDELIDSASDSLILD
jgi:subtilisin family serine protease